MADNENLFDVKDTEGRKGLSEILAATENRGRLLLGGLCAYGNTPGLQNAGVTHILSCAEELGLSDKEGDFQCKHLKLDDTVSFDLRPFFDEGVAFMKEALSSPESTLFVHCSQGKSRSTSFILAYLISETEMNLKEAWSLVRKCRKKVHPNPGFVLALIDLEKTLRGEVSLESYNSQLMRRVMEGDDRYPGVIHRNEDLLLLWEEHKDVFSFRGERGKKPRRKRNND